MVGPYRVTISRSFCRGRLSRPLVCRNGSSASKARIDSVADKSVPPLSINDSECSIDRDGLFVVVLEGCATVVETHRIHLTNASGLFADSGSLPTRPMNCRRTVQ